MPTVYIDATVGSDAYTYVQAQSALTPWATIEKAIATGVAGDTVSIVGGTYTAPSTSHDFTKNLLNVAQVEGAVVLRAFPAFATQVCRTTNALTAGTFTFNGIVFDCESVAATGLELAADANVINYNILNCTALGTLRRSINVLAYHGDVVVDNFSTNFVGTFTGGTNAGIINHALDAGSASATAAFSATVTNSDFTVTSPSSQAATAVYFSAASTRAQTVTLTYTGNNATVTAPSDFIAVALWAIGGDSTNISDNIITVNSTNTSGDSYGIRVADRSSSATSNNAVISGNSINANFPAGFAIVLGNNISTTNYMASPVVKGNRILGNYQAVSTPHGIAARQEITNCQYISNYTEGMYASYLVSKVTSGIAVGNVSKDCYGADFYCKSCTAFTYIGNTAIQTGKYARRNLAPFSIDTQSGAATVATTYNSNTFICSETDFTRVGAMANITLNNSGTFTNNIYIVPDTWDTDTTDRFFVGGEESGRSGATGYTIDEWMSGTAGSVSAVNGTGTISISGEQVILMPIAKIKQLLYSYNSSNIIYVPGGGLTRIIGAIPL
jgi:hypothetical protein